MGGSMKRLNSKKIRRRTDLALAAANLYYEQTGVRIPTAKVYHTYTTEEDEYTLGANAEWVVSRIQDDMAAIL